MIDNGLFHLRQSTTPKATLIEELRWTRGLLGYSTFAKAMVDAVGYSAFAKASADKKRGLKYPGAEAIYQAQASVMITAYLL
ncbi:MAG: hypothetical protein RLQ12_20235 [Cyclobacteriaceae bacterium]